MTLTYGHAPFSPEPLGTFNFDLKEPKSVLYWHDFPKRFRVVINVETVVDSRRVKALHETGRIMRPCVPRDDVRMDLLQATDRFTSSQATGAALGWAMRDSRMAAKDIAWSYDDPPASAESICGYLSFNLDAVDAWYQEDDKGYSHPRDPFHRFDIHKTSRHVLVRANGIVIADSNKVRVLFETSVQPRFYLPPEDVRINLLEKSTNVSQCPYKGDGQHWHVLVGGQHIDDVAWSLTAPLGEAMEISEWFCFYPEKIEVQVNGTRLHA